MTVGCFVAVGNLDRTLAGQAKCNYGGHILPWTWKDFGEEKENDIRMALKKVLDHHSTSEEGETVHCQHCA